MAALPERHRPGLLRRRRAAWTSLLQVWGVETHSQDTRPWTAAAALRLGAAARRHHRCCRSLCHKQACKTRLQFIFFPSHRDKCTFVCFCGSSFLSPGETAAAAARRLGCCALVVQHGHHCCRSPFWGARKTHIISRIFSLCVRDLSSVANPVALTRVDVTTRLDLRSSWSWLVCSQCCYCIQVCFDCPESAVSLFAHHPELVAEGFGLHFVEFCLSRGPVAGRRMSRIFCSGERRLFLSLRRRNHLVSDVDRRETGLFPRKTKTSLPGSFFFFSKKNVNLSTG